MQSQQPTIVVSQGQGGGNNMTHFIAASSPQLTGKVLQKRGLSL